MFSRGRTARSPLRSSAPYSLARRVAKPDPEIYLRAVRRLGVQLETTVYIGDGADSELTGAKQAGLRACRAAWFVPNSSQKVAWPELVSCEDVLRLVAAG